MTCFAAVVRPSGRLAGSRLRGSRWSKERHTQAMFADSYSHDLVMQPSFTLAYLTCLPTTHSIRVVFFDTALILSMRIGWTGLHNIWQMHELNCQFNAWYTLFPLPSAAAAGQKVRA